MNLEKLTFRLKTMMKKNPVVLHENCSCCGGSLQSLSFKEIDDLQLDVDDVHDDVVKFTLDKTQMYGVLILIDINHDRYKTPNYLWKHIKDTTQKPYMHPFNDLHGDMLVFNDEEMANDFHEMCKYYIRYG